jgi:hypothetical protein
MTITRSIMARGYFSPVIDYLTLLRLATTDPVVVVDHAGRPFDRELLPKELPVPGLLVGTVTEAVKQVEGGRLIADLDRNTLWAVHGFVLDKKILDALGDGQFSAFDLIRAVSAAGFRWLPTIL